MFQFHQEKAFEAVLFDLDGTLLRAEMSTFIPRYVEALADYCARRVSPARFSRAMLKAIRELILTEGDGRETNEERLYRTLRREIDLPAGLLQDSLEHFSGNGLDGLRHLIRPIPLAQQIVRECREQGVPLVLATNPVFPRFMVAARLAWAGLAEADFAHLTSYENSHYCKPQSGYFRQVAETIGVSPQQCLMVGNDLSHDLAAVAVGMEAFLVDTWVVEREGPTWPCDHRGDHAALQRFLRERF